MKAVAIRSMVANMPSGAQLKLLLFLDSDCSQLDTNKDGSVTIADDMYTPYYPGMQCLNYTQLCMSQLLLLLALLDHHLSCCR